MLAHVRQRIHGWFAGFHQKLHRVIAHSGPRVSQVAGEIGGGFLRELESLPARAMRANLVMTGIKSPVRLNSLTTENGLGYTPPQTQCMSASRWPSRGSWKYVIVPKVSPVGRKTNSTGLSKPPPDTHSRPVPSGCTRQMREAFP